MGTDNVECLFSIVQAAVGTPSSAAAIQQFGRMMLERRKATDPARVWQYKRRKRAKYSHHKDEQHQLSFDTPLGEDEPGQRQSKKRIGPTQVTPREMSKRRKTNKQ